MLIALRLPCRRGRHGCSMSCMGSLGSPPLRLRVQLPAPRPEAVIRVKDPQWELTSRHPDGADIEAWHSDGTGEHIQLQQPHGSGLAD